MLSENNEPYWQWNLNYFFRFKIWPPTIHISIKIPLRGTRPLRGLLLSNLGYPSQLVRLIVFIERGYVPNRLSPVVITPQFFSPVLRSEMFGVYLPPTFISYPPTLCGVPIELMPWMESNKQEVIPLGVTGYKMLMSAHPACSSGCRYFEWVRCCSSFHNLVLYIYLSPL